MREGPHTEDGKQGTEQASKVVRLPRDWLGPREHLVPFGIPPTAETEPEQSDFATPSAGFAPSADAFWGEDSAAIHHAVAAPARDGAAVAAPTQSDARWIRLGKLSSHRQLAVGAGIAVAAALAIAPAAMVIIQPSGADNSSARIRRIATSNRPAQVLRVPTATVGNRGSRAAGPRRHHRPVVHHGARTGASVHATPSHSLDSGSRHAVTTPSAPDSNSTAAQSPATYTNSSSPPHYTTPASAGFHPATGSGSGSGSGSGGPSKATLRSLVTGAGTCSC